MQIMPPAPSVGGIIILPLTHKSEALLQVLEALIGGIIQMFSWF